MMIREKSNKKRGKIILIILIIILIVIVLGLIFLAVVFNIKTNTQINNINPALKNIDLSEARVQENETGFLNALGNFLSFNWMFADVVPVVDENDPFRFAGQPCNPTDPNFGNIILDLETQAGGCVSYNCFWNPSKGYDTYQATAKSSSSFCGEPVYADTNNYPCDVPDMCDGNGHCIRFKVADTRCDLTMDYRTNPINPGEANLKYPPRECEERQGKCNGIDGNCYPQPKPAGTVCRAAVSDPGDFSTCDVAETCDGTSLDCPFNSYLESGAQCRKPKGDCDQPEVCNGYSEMCPPDQKYDRINTLQDENGNEKPCRDAVISNEQDTLSCDVAEFCGDKGPSDYCPSDSFALTTIECRAAVISNEQDTLSCDVAEFCTGISASCPVNGFSSYGTECRAIAGDCDISESCTGISASCPTNQFKIGDLCRASAGECDAPEYCNTLTYYVNKNLMQELFPSADQGPYCPIDIGKINSDGTPFVLSEKTDFCPETVCANFNSENDPNLQYYPDARPNPCCSGDKTYLACTSEGNWKCTIDCPDLDTETGACQSMLCSSAIEQNLNFNDKCDGFCGDGKINNWYDEDNDLWFQEQCDNGMRCAVKNPATEEYEIMTNVACYSALDKSCQEAYPDQDAKCMTFNTPECTESCTKPKCGDGIIYYDASYDKGGVPRTNLNEDCDDGSICYKSKTNEEALDEKGQTKYCSVDPSICSDGEECRVFESELCDNKCNFICGNGVAQKREDDKGEDCDPGKHCKYAPLFPVDQYDKWRCESDESICDELNFNNGKEEKTCNECIVTETTDCSATCKCEGSYDPGRVDMVCGKTPQNQDYIFSTKIVWERNLETSPINPDEKECVITETKLPYMSPEDKACDPCQKCGNYETEKLEMKPGETKEVIMQLTNFEPIDLKFEVQVSGIDAKWLNPEDNIINADDGKSITFEITATDNDCSQVKKGQIKISFPGAFPLENSKNIIKNIEVLTKCDCSDISKESEWFNDVNAVKECIIDEDKHNNPETIIKTKNNQDCNKDYDFSICRYGSREDICNGDITENVLNQITTLDYCSIRTSDSEKYLFAGKKICDGYFFEITDEERSAIKSINVLGGEDLDEKCLGIFKQFFSGESIGLQGCAKNGDLYVNLNSKGDEIKIFFIHESAHLLDFARNRKDSEEIKSIEYESPKINEYYDYYRDAMDNFRRTPEGGVVFPVVEECILGSCKFEYFDNEGYDHPQWGFFRAYGAYNEYEDLAVSVESVRQLADSEVFTTHPSKDIYKKKLDYLYSKKYITENKYKCVKLI